jgi:hypothetical protein
MKYDRATIYRFLGDTHVDHIVKEMQIDKDPIEVQFVLIDMLNEYVLDKVSLEVLKALPRADHQAFEDFIGKGDLDGLRSFLSERIPDVDRLIEHAATTAYDSARSRAQEIAGSR